MTYIIAEVGGNHDGKLDDALELIQCAAKAGCDAVKFQSYTAEKLVHPTAKALPQAKGYTRQLDRFKDLEFSQKDWELLIRYCKEWHIDFLTTPFDLESLDFFKDKMKYIKVSSGDLTYTRLLRAVSETGKPVILSTGMATHGEIDDASRFFNPTRLTVCHCVSLYPCPDEEANLGVIQDLKSRFSSVGYSDHTVGVTAPIIAASMGVTVIEKHFTLDCAKDYGDHPLSLEPDEMIWMVSEIRRINRMMGNIKPSPLEKPNVMRRGAYAKRPLEIGHVLSENDIIELRPQNGRRPDRLVGTRTTKTLKELDLIG